MGKKEIMLSYNKVVALLILLIFNTIANAQVDSKMKFTFESKEQIADWGEKEFGYKCNILSYKVNKKDVKPHANI
jgi:hypothetical protein